LKTGSSTTRRTKSGRPSIAIAGAGSLAEFLAPALREAGYKITEIITRARPGATAIRRARVLAKKVGASAVTAETAPLDASVLWVCVPDHEIRAAAADLAERAAATAKASMGKRRAPAKRVALHSSGALLAEELAPLRKAGFTVASVHPLMTFVSGARPSLTRVPFALEGDEAATRIARRIVHTLGAESFGLPSGRKAAYHAWATLTSPLLVAYLVALEEAAREAGLSGERARRMSLPIILQTLANYGSLGPASSFSGPFIRGDAETVGKHLSLLGTNPIVRPVYVALARVALEQLPVKNRGELRRLLE